MRVRNLASAAAALLVAACTHPVMPESQPKLDIPKTWAEVDGKSNMRGERWPDNAWWRQMGCAELSRLVEEGKANNLEIAVAVARVHEAESAARIAGAPLLPSADVGVDFNKTTGLFGGNGSTYASGLVNVGYEVDFWGKNKAGAQAAQASLLANRFDRETVALTVTGGIVSTYLQVLSLRDQLDIARQNVSNAERVLALVEAQGRAGAATTLDLARQRAAVAGQQATVPSLVQQEREAKAALAILLGKPAQAFEVNEAGLGNIQLPEVAPGLPSELLSRRPDIRRAEANLQAANANLAKARAALFPSIHLSASAGAQSSALMSLFNTPNLIKNLGVDLVAPIFDAGRLDSERDMAMAQKQELLHVYQSTVLNAFAEVDNALGQIHSLTEQAQLKQTELEQASVAFELSERRYRDGAEDLKTVLDTQRTLSSVQNEMGQLKLRRLKAAVQLYKTLGGGWQDDSAHDRSLLAPQAAMTR